MTLEPRSRATVASDRLQQLLQYWKKQAAGRLMPSRADIDPIDIPTLLPNLLLFDVEPGSGRLRVRVVGTAIVEMYGSDYTGRFLDEVYFGDRQASVLHGYAECLRSRQIYVSEESYRTPDDVRRRVERLILPISDDSETITHILAGLEFIEYR